MAERVWDRLLAEQDKTTTSLHYAFEKLHSGLSTLLAADGHMKERLWEVWRTISPLELADDLPVEIKDGLGQIAEKIRTQEALYPIDAFEGMAVANLILSLYTKVIRLEERAAAS